MVYPKSRFKNYFPIKVQITNHIVGGQTIIIMENKNKSMNEIDE